jgi:hypothetical protein
MTLPNLDLPDEEAARAQYRSTVQRIKEDWAIDSVPLTGRGVEEVFTMAIRQAPPFKEEGAGFQDTVIYMSVIDHLRDHGGAAAYISNDGVFKKQRERIIQIARDAEVHLRLYRTLAEIDAAFQVELGEEIGRALEQDRQRAFEALTARLPQIEEFISNNIEIPKLHPFVGDVVEIESIEILQIEYVLTTYRRGEERANISFQATIRVHVLMDTSPYSAFRRVMGYKAERERAEDFDEESTMITHELEYRVEIEATGIVVDDQFDDIELKSARMKSY